MLPNQANNFLSADVSWSVDYFGKKKNGSEKSGPIPFAANTDSSVQLDSLTLLCEEEFWMNRLDLEACSVFK